MTNKAYREETLELRDGTEVILRELVISKLRVFQKTWNEHIKTTLQSIEELNLSDTKSKNKSPGITEEEMLEKAYTTYIKLSAICLSDQLKMEEDSVQVFESKLEDLLDESSILRILKVCGGLDLNDNGETDPN